MTTNGKRPRPIAAPVQPEGIPGELITLDQWLVWKYQPKTKDGWTKPPYSAHTGQKADVTLSSNYSSFEEAMSACKRLKADGVGFALIVGGDLTFVDLDHCRDAETGGLAAWAVAYIRRFPVSYVEVSPSGTGLHVIVKGRLPNANGIKRRVAAPDAHPQAAIEIYSGGRYATITGHVIDDGHRAPGDAQAEILALYAELNPETETPAAPSLHLVSNAQIDIAERLNVARNAVNGAAFTALYDNADLTAYQGDHSAADLGLCSRLGFYLDYRPELIDTAFRNSALMRSKWDERHRYDGATYGQMTIEKVLSSRGEAYAPSQPISAASLPTTTSNDPESDSFVGTTGVPTKEIIDRFLTAAELCALVPEEPEWIARPFVVAGGITELDGAPKAGKSTLLGYLVRRIAEGGDFLGAQTEQGPVVYLTEQSPGTFREVLARSNLTGCTNVFILSWHDVRQDQWAAVVEAAYQKCVREESLVLIVDTLPQFAGLRGDTENSAGDALAAIQPLQAVAARGIAVVIVRHDRKTGGEVGTSARGSSAFGGAVDIILQIKKAEGNARPTLRVISALSRFDETPAETTIERTTEGTFVSLEPKQAFESNRVKTAIADMAPRTEHDAMSLDEFLAEIPNAKRPTVNDALKSLVAEGILARRGPGTRGNPYRFWVINEAEAVEEMTKNRHPKLPRPNLTEVLSEQKKRAKETSAGTAPRNGADSFVGAGVETPKGVSPVPTKRNPRPESEPTEVLSEVLSDRRLTQNEIDDLLSDDED